MYFNFRRGFGVIYRENLFLKIPKELANLWLYTIENEKIFRPSVVYCQKNHFFNS